MKLNDDPLAALVHDVKQLPGLGPKSAQRIVFYLLQRNRALAKQLADQLTRSLNAIHHCQRCYTFTLNEYCDICADKTRDKKTLCIVEMPQDMMMMEATKIYNGYYFILMQLLSPVEQSGVDDLPFNALFDRIQDDVEEVIIATNFTAEGELTAHALAKFLGGFEIKVTRLAQGLPLNTPFLNLDGPTLAQAMIDRLGIS